MTDLSRALKDLVELFERFGAQYVVMGGIAVRVYGIPRPTHDVDFTAAIDRDRQKQLLKRRRREELDGLSINFVSPEDLILLKLLASRPRDIADIGDVLFTQGQLDAPYMLHWAEQLGIKEALETILAEHSRE